MSDMDRLARIRERAYLIWDSEGRPPDRAAIHWRMAERIVDEEDGPAAMSGLDEAIDDSFPASDPPAMTQPTRAITHDSTPLETPQSGRRTG